MSKVDYEAYVERGWVRFRIGNQGFTLRCNAEPGDEEAEHDVQFMAKMLTKALRRLAGDESNDTSEP